jgi:hypothetical protein
MSFHCSAHLLHLHLLPWLPAASAQLLLLVVGVLVLVLVLVGQR